MLNVKPDRLSERVCRQQRTVFRVEGRVVAPEHDLVVGRLKVAAERCKRIKTNLHSVGRGRAWIVPSY